MLGKPRKSVQISDDESHETELFVSKAVRIDGGNSRTVYEMPHVGKKESLDASRISSTASDGVSIKSVAVSPLGNEVKLYTDGGVFAISAADFKTLGLPEAVQAEKYPFFLADITVERLSFLVEKLRAVKYLTYLLDFGDKSEKALMLKLREKEYSREAGKAAIDILKRAGILDEVRICDRKIRCYALDKGFGPFRIKRELLAKGFNEEAIKEAFDYSDVDFDETLRISCKKLFTRQHITDRQKLCDRLIRNGFSYSDIREAVGEYTFDGDD